MSYCQFSALTCVPVRCMYMSTNFFLLTVMAIISCKVIFTLFLVYWNTVHMYEYIVLSYSYCRIVAMPVTTYSITSVRSDTTSEGVCCQELRIHAEFYNRYCWTRWMTYRHLFSFSRLHGLRNMVRHLAKKPDIVRCMLWRGVDDDITSGNLSQLDSNFYEYLGFWTATNHMS